MNQEKIELRRLELWIQRERHHYLRIKRELRVIKESIQARGYMKRSLGIFYYPVYYIRNIFLGNFSCYLTWKKFY